MDTKIETTLTEFAPDKQSPTRPSLDEAEAQSEVSVDYAGASKKTDPAEIALVRKLDLCMMVSVQFSKSLLHCAVGSHRARLTMALTNLGSLSYGYCAL